MASLHPAERNLQDALAARFRTQYPGLCLDIHPDDDMYAFAVQHLGLRGPEAFREYLQTGRINFMMLEQVLAWAGKSWGETKAVLDFASGYGRTTRFLTTAIPASRIWVSDILAPAVAYQTSTLGVHPILSHTDPATLQLPRSYDLVSVISLFSHLPQTTFGPWLQKLTTALEPGGILVFTTQGPRLYREQFGEEMRDPFVFKVGSEIPSLDPGSYGQTFCVDTHVRELLDEIPGVTLMAHIPGGLNKHQDVYVLGKGRDIPQAPCRIRVPPNGTIEYIQPENGTLSVRGWALDRFDSGPVTRVELFLDDDHLGDADLNEMRPDLAEAFGHGPSVQGGWSFTGSVPANLRSALWLTAWIQDREGIREFLLARNEPRTTACR